MLWQEFWDKKIKEIANTFQIILDVGEGSPIARILDRVFISKNQTSGSGYSIYLIK